MTDPLERFEDVADDYESFVEKIPKYDRIRETIVEVLQQWNREGTPEAVAEIGVGTGGLARFVLERFAPDVFHGVDGALAMLEQAEEQLESFDRPRVELEHLDFRNWSPSRPYDWVYSNLSIHHLHDLEKRDLFNRIHGGLGPSGRFLLSDLVRIPDKQRELYKRIYWNRLESLGYEETEIEERWKQHRTNDVPADLRATLRWLREAGFGLVECVWKDFNRAIIIAMKQKRS